MDQKTIQILFALLRSAICGEKLSEEMRCAYSAEMLPSLLKLASIHDVAHLAAFALKENGLLTPNELGVEKYIFKAVYRHEQIKFEYQSLCAALEAAEIPFLPLKGSVLRSYYAEPWMRTSCDIDVLVRVEDLERAILCLKEKLKYEEKERATHDVSLFSSGGVHVELHFDLVEEGRANNAINVLRSVWENTTPREGYAYFLEMSDAFFYFYHIAHMAKHFETGGCGIRPFIDLWILDHMEKADPGARDALLEQSGLLIFARTCRSLSAVWMGNQPASDLDLQMQNFLLHGGAYGSADNRVALQQKKKGGRFGYLWSRIFIPYEKLKRYYPVLEKHRWLTPLMQIRRWFMLFSPDIAKMAKRELKSNKGLNKSKADEMQIFLDNIGL